MKNWSLIFCLVIVAYFGSVGGGFAKGHLPMCEGSPFIVASKKMERGSRKKVNFYDFWDKCIGQIFVIQNGNRYIGEWKNGHINGWGTYFYGGRWKKEGFYTNQGDKYEGEWKDSLWHGEGTYTFADGTLKEGIWENNKFHKEKKLSNKSNLPNCIKSAKVWNNCFSTYADEDGEYIGDWHDNTFNGYGKYKFANGDIYEGVFEKGSQTGMGIYRYGSKSKHSGDTYLGGFRDGLFHGRGAYLFANGNKHVGDFKNDKKEGKGTYTTHTGSVYSGDWENNTLNGFATSINKLGKYIGEFKDGKRHGLGTFTRPDGTVYKGRWKKEELYKKKRKKHQKK